MKYKGYNIDKVSRYICNGFDNSEGFYWCVNKNFKNVYFNTLRKAMEYIDEKINTEN